MEEDHKRLNFVTLDAKLFRVTASLYSLSLLELASVLNIPQAIVYRKRLKVSFSQANHLDCLKTLIELAIQYFGNEEAANYWLRSFNIALNARPLSLCRTNEGIDQVKNTVLKLMHGMTA
jgi:uncharacterized protein (DUF2384 family)